MKRQFMVKVSSLLLALLLCVAAAFTLVTVINPITVYAASINQSYVGEYNGNYYDNLNTDLKGTQFRTELANLITTTHKNNPKYSGTGQGTLAWLFERADLDIATGKVVEIYTGNLTNGFTGNREHVWPKQDGDAFPVKSEAGSDGHHLRPCNSTVNSSRGNKSFDEVTSNVVKESNGTCYMDGTFFYPGKGFRGQTARILMYVQTRWGDKYNLKFVLGDGHSKTIGDIETLFKWHLEEPPTANEIYRNNAVADYQGNRNPFIDHPEYAAMIYCYDGQSYNDELLNVLKNSNDPYNNLNKVEPTGITLSNSNLSLSVGDTKQLTATVTPANATSTVIWTTSNSSVATVSNGKVTAVGKGTATITATSTENANVKATATVTVSTIAPTSITLSNSNVALSVGDTEQITVKVSPTNAVSTVTWSTSDSSVATVSNGKVTAVGKGTATITATSTENANIKATATVTVKQLENIQITGSLTKTSYLLGDKIDCGGVTVKAIYSDSSQVDITQQVEWATNDNSSNVTKNSTSIGFTYGGKWYDAGAIKVIWPTGITVVGTADKTVYFQNQTFDPTGLSVKLVYSDDSTQAVSLDDCTWVDKETNSTTLTGETTHIVCKYNGFVSEPIQVKVVYPVGIVVEGTADKTVYFPNKTFDSTGLSVKLVYSDNSTQAVSLDDCTWVDKETNSATLTGETTHIVCKYNGFVSEPIQVKVIYPVGIVVEGTADKTVYFQNQTFDPTGLSVKLVYSDNSTESIEFEDCSWVDKATGSTIITLETTEIVCKYQTYTSDPIQITVDYKLVNIIITGVSTTQYIEGEKFNPNGLTVTANYSDGTTQNIELSSCAWVDTATQSDVLTLQTTSVSCTYNGITVKVCDVTVTRNPAIVQFENAVANVTTAQGLQNKFTAIKQALDAYNGLTQEEKDAAVSLYNTLQAEITAYNTQANKNNQDISSAVETVVISLSKVLIVLFALLAVLGIYKR